jgi:hypothetical protein
VASNIASSTGDPGFAPETGIWRRGHRGGDAWELGAAAGAGVADELKRCQCIPRSRFALFTMSSFPSSGSKIGLPSRPGCCGRFGGSPSPRRRWPTTTAAAAPASGVVGSSRTGARAGSSPSPEAMPARARDRVAEAPSVRTVGGGLRAGAVVRGAAQQAFVTRSHRRPARDFADILVLSAGDAGAGRSRTRGAMA